METPKGYKWVVLYGGWTIIPKANSEKFCPSELTLPILIPEDPFDEDLVDWGEDDDQDYMAEDFDYDDTILEVEDTSLDVPEELQSLDNRVPSSIEPHISSAEVN